MSKEINKINIEKEFAIFSDSQIEAIKLIVKKGFWGDCSQEFADKKTYYAYGYFTNLNKGKEWSGTLSGISKKIKSSGINIISMFSDWWQDGSGDMMFFNMELIDEKELEEWANK